MLRCGEVRVRSRLLRCSARIEIRLRLIRCWEVKLSLQRQIRQSTSAGSNPTTLHPRAFLAADRLDPRTQKTREAILRPAENFAATLAVSVSSRCWRYSTDRAVCLSLLMYSHFGASSPRNRPASIRAFRISRWLRPRLVHAGARLGRVGAW